MDWKVSLHSSCRDCWHKDSKFNRSHYGNSPSIYKQSSHSLDICVSSVTVDRIYDSDRCINSHFDGIPVINLADPKYFIHPSKKHDERGTPVIPQCSNINLNANMLKLCLWYWFFVCSSVSKSIFFNLKNMWLLLCW